MASQALILDALASLLEAEQGSVFRFMRAGNPYLTRATVEVRRRVEAMAETSDRHAAELAGLIQEMGGNLRPMGVWPEEQYLAFLSLKFLLPKLAEAKRGVIERYENTLRAVAGAAGEVVGVLESHLGRHREDLASLEQASSAMAKGAGT